MKSVSAAYRVFRANETLVAERWDEFVRQSPQCNPFATRVWLDAITEATGMTCDIWVAAKGDQLVAGVPILVERRRGRRFGCVPLLTPYTSYLYGHQLYESTYPSKTTTTLIEVTKSLATPIRKAYWRVTQKLLSDVDDVRPWRWDRWLACPHYTYHMDLSEEWRVSHAVRKHVRKCEEGGFQVSWDWQIERFWETFLRTQERQGFSVPMTLSVFARLANKLHDAGLAWMATSLTSNGETVASRILLSIPGTADVFDWVAGTESSALSSGATPWLMTRIGAEAKRLGYLRWDLCGADFESIARFKGELGGKLIHYFEVRTPNRFVEFGKRSVRALRSWLARRR
jgi:hypothetical protein